MCVHGSHLHLFYYYSKKEPVSRYNINKLKQLVKNGPYVHPGANLIRMQDGFAKSLAFGDRDKAAKNLRFGDIVER